MCLLKTNNIIAADINNTRLLIAEEFGAIKTINLRDDNVFKTIKEFFKDGIDIIFEVVGIKSNFELATKLAAPGCRICVVGYIREKALLNCAKLMFYELDIRGSLGCSPVDFKKVIELVKEGKINADKMIVNKYGLNQINTALDDLRNNRGLRPVIVFD